MEHQNIVTFETERCKGCELCVSVCLVKIISLGKSINSRGYHIAHIEDMELCIGCANCAQMCPDSVITIERRKRDEQSAYERK